MNGKYSFLSKINNMKYLFDDILIIKFTAATSYKSIAEYLLILINLSFPKLQSLIGIKFTFILSEKFFPNFEINKLHNLLLLS